MAKRKDNTVTQRLQTLSDYRRVAKQTLFTSSFPIYGVVVPESTSIYDAVREALRNLQNLIWEAQVNKPEIEQWGATWFPGTECELNNMPLFNCVKLMELAIFYSEQKKKDEAFKGWLKRPDKDIRVFTSVGLSYLEAAFDYVEERGQEIICCLKNSYRKHNDAGRIDYLDPFMFLNKTPEVDTLVFMPNPDITVKAWYNRILDCLRRHFSASEYTSPRLEVEFKAIYQQLEYEKTALGSVKRDSKDTVKKNISKTGKQSRETSENGGSEIMPPEGEWSKPMGKSKMMGSLGMSSYKKFNAFAKKHGIREAGNRQTFQIRLDGMDKTTRNKLERA